jgi:hypothetical protein
MGAGIKLSRLREIGWSKWDPIGLNGLEHRPDDEYDSDLLAAVVRLRDGAEEPGVADYLVDIETEAMGLEPSETARQRALETVRAIRAYLDELRDPA